MQKANHKNVLKVHGWSQWDGAVAIVTELMRGRNLKRLLHDKNVPLHPIHRLRMSRDIAEGVAFIHNFSLSKRLIHGDLKPENILLTEDLICKVGDFGCSRMINRTGQTTTSEAHQRKQEFTPVYAAPERLKHGCTPPKKEADTYSYTLIIHGILTRERPNEHSVSDQAYLDTIKRGERPCTNAIDDLEKSLNTVQEKEIIHCLREVMTKCWQQKRDDRSDMTIINRELDDLMLKQNQSDVLRVVDQSVEKFRFFDPTKCNTGFIPLSCFQLNIRNSSLGKPYSLIHKL